MNAWIEFESGARCSLLLTFMDALARPEDGGVGSRPTFGMAPGGGSTGGCRVDFEHGTYLPPPSVPTAPSQQANHPARARCAACPHPPPPLPVSGGSSLGCRPTGRHRRVRWAGRCRRLGRAVARPQHLQHVRQPGGSRAEGERRGAGGAADGGVLRVPEGWRRAAVLRPPVRRARRPHPPPTPNSSLPSRLCNWGWATCPLECD